MIKHRIVYEIKDENLELVKLSKDFENFADACTFLKEIKTQSVSKPVLEEIPINKTFRSKNTMVIVS